MFRQKSFKNSIKGKTDAHYSLSRQFPWNFRVWLGSRWTVVSVTVALLLCFAIYAEADLVYGRVYGAEGKFPPEGTFTLTNKEDEKTYTVKTDKDKSYSIFLPPGIYRVKFVDEDDIEWQAEIRSVEDPIQQDINLKRAR